VDALPSHRDLDDTVQLVQCAGARHQHAPPHHGADPEQPNLDLHDLGPVGVGRGPGSFKNGSGSLRGSRHPASLSPIASTVAGTPDILMVSMGWVRRVSDPRETCLGKPFSLAELVERVCGACLPRQRALHKQGHPRRVSIKLQHAPNCFQKSGGTLQRRQV